MRPCIAVIALLSSIWLNGVIGQNLTTAVEISQSSGVRIEIDPDFSGLDSPPVCTDSYIRSITVQLDGWLKKASHGVLGYSLLLPPLTLTASNNDNTTVVRRDLNANQDDRELVGLVCNSCRTYACKVWCGCRLCQKDDDDVRRLSLRGNGRRRLQSYVGSNETTGGRTYWTKSPTVKPTARPSKSPTQKPTPRPTNSPTPRPTKSPTPQPTPRPTKSPTPQPTPRPTKSPTPRPTKSPTAQPTPRPTKTPTPQPTPRPTRLPTPPPTVRPTKPPTPQPTNRPEPTHKPTPLPLTKRPEPTQAPTGVTPQPTQSPTARTTPQPTVAPTVLRTTHRQLTPAPTDQTPEPTAQTSHPSQSPSAQISTPPSEGASIGTSSAPQPTQAPTVLAQNKDKADAFSVQVQTWAQAWVGANDSTGCMGKAENLVVIVTFF